MRYLVLILVLVGNVAFGQENMVGQWETNQVTPIASQDTDTAAKMRVETYTFKNNGTFSVDITQRSPFPNIKKVVYGSWNTNTQRDSINLHNTTYNHAGKRTWQNFRCKFLAQTDSSLVLDCKGLMTISKKTTLKEMAEMDPETRNTWIMFDETEPFTINFKKQTN